MALTFDALKDGYVDMWSTVDVRAGKRAEVAATARAIIKNRARYAKVTAETSVPWFVIGLIHAMECTQFPRMSQHLHNGDPLTHRTVQVPKGRPAAGDPPFSFEESAVDALRYDGLDQVKDWSIARVAFELERFNGFGYRRHHPDVNTPYLWSGTNHYESGKYVADGVWSSTAVSVQVGAMAILKGLCDLDSTIATEYSAPANDEPASGGFPKAGIEATPADIIQVSTKAQGASILKTAAATVTVGAAVAEASDTISSVTTNLGVLQGFASAVASLGSFAKDHALVALIVFSGIVFWFGGWFIKKVIADFASGRYQPSKGGPQ